jgi:hypothetical protein
MSGFNITVQVDDEVDAWVSKNDLLRQIKRWDKYELEELQETILTSLNGLTPVNSRMSLQQELIQEILQPVINKITIAEAEEIAKKYGL